MSTFLQINFFAVQLVLELTWPKLELANPKKILFLKWQLHQKKQGKPDIG